MSNQDFAISSYHHLITTRPYDINRVVISDLHLSADEPALVQAFLALLDDVLVLPNVHQLYILGDWFDAWIGDDAYLSLSATEQKRHWLTPLITKLTELKNRGCQSFVMHGNRDFLIGQDFCDSFGGQLIEEPYLLKLGKMTYRLEHGDALCTDDKRYQRFRKVMRNPLVQWLLLKQPLHKRQALAQKIRSQSALDKSAKSLQIMDVNEQAVTCALKKVDGLIHGHTHRPACHQTHLALNAKARSQTLEFKKRYVLGDWRILDPDTRCEQVQAVIGLALDTQISSSFELVTFEWPTR